MAGLLHSSSHRPTTSSSHLLLLLTILPLTLASFAFILQWRGGVTDPITRWSPDHSQFPGMALTTTQHHQQQQQKPHSDCSTLLFANNHSPSFPYFRDWKFDFSSDLTPKVLFFSFSILPFSYFPFKIHWVFSSSCLASSFCI